MTIDNLFKLIDAGFTKDDIMKLSGLDGSVTADNNSAKITTIPESVPVVSEVKQNEVKTEVAEAGTKADDSKLDNLVNQINELKNMVHGKAIQESEMPETKEPNLIDIMSDMIR